MKTRSATSRLLTIIASLGSLVTASCNKDVPEPVPNTFPVSTGTSIGGLLANDTGLSLMRAAVVRAGIMPQLQDNSRTFTLFAPDNAAFSASGIRTVADIEAMPLSTLVPLVQYHLSPQKLSSSMIPSDDISLPYPSVLNPAPTLSPLFRLSLYPSRRNGVWVNNLPVKSVDVEASNGTIHRMAGLLPPPSRTLWERINTDSDLRYLKEAVLRADSGYASNSSESFVRMLSGIGTDITLFAPNDKAFQSMWQKLIYKDLVSAGFHPATALEMAQMLASSPAVFTNSRYLLSARAVRDILSYHVCTRRVFVNAFPVFPADPLYLPTLLNTAVPTHRGMGVVSYVNNPPFASAANVKGIGVSSGNLIVNRTPDPTGSSDQNMVNGVLHKIDQVMEHK